MVKPQYIPGDIVKVKKRSKEYPGTLMLVSLKSKYLYQQYYLIDIENKIRLLSEDLIKRKATEKEVERYKRLRIASEVAR